VGTHDRPQSWTGRVPIRYADDFVVLVSGTREQAEQEKDELARYLHETMRLELSIDKTQVVDLIEGFQFLGHRVRYKWHPRFGYAETRDPQRQAGGPSVYGKADDRPRQRLVTDSASPETQSYLAGMGELLSLLHRRKPSVRNSRLLCRRPHLALADEEAWSPPS
jgi:hypothetical protein